MIRCLATVVASISALAMVFAPSAHADPALDEQYLELVRSNGVTGGQDGALLAFAQQFCSPSPPPFLDTVFPLYGQGVWPQQIFILQTAASRTYCPNRIPVAPLPFYF